MNRLTPEDYDPSAIKLHIHLDISQEEEPESSPSSPSTPRMPLPPFTTPVPEPVFMPGMSHRAGGPPPPPQGAEPSPLPIRSKPTNDHPSSSSSSSLSSAPPVAARSFPLPKLRLRVDDLAHPGSTIFLTAVDASAVLDYGVQAVLRTLYVSPDDPQTHTPPTRSVTLILRDMDGVAYTTGSDLDNDHKEIHFSLRYIAGIAPERRTHEITGVLIHELVHCFQYNGLGAGPGGLIEGVADFVRLREDLAPPHWRRDDASATRWDAGYQHTAYFLEYLEGRFGAGTVVRLNEKLRAARYEEAAFWAELLGAPVARLYQDYRDEAFGGGGGEKGKEKEGKEEKGEKGKETKSEKTADEGTQT